jgi:hypothetical protein
MGKEISKVVLLCAAGAVPLVVLFAWLMHQVSYRVTDTHVEISVLGLRLRRVALSDIRRVSTRRPHRHERCEHWWNTLEPSHRFLVIHRRTGWRRHVVITPEHRYVLRSELKAAIARAKLPEPVTDDVGNTDGEPGEERS